MEFVKLAFISASRSTLVLRPPPQHEYDGFIQSFEIFESPNSFIEDSIKEALKGFSLGLIPKLSDEGTSGTYFLQSIQRKTTVKP